MSFRDSEIHTVGIVGSGAMGRGIAQIAALGGLTVRLFDTNPQAVLAARDYLSDTLNKLVEKGKLQEADAHAALARIQAAGFTSELADCDVVIEAIVEKLDVNEQAIHGEDGELYRFELRNAAHSILSTFQISISERITDLNCP